MTPTERAQLYQAVLSRDQVMVRTMQERHGITDAVMTTANARVLEQCPVVDGGHFPGFTRSTDLLEEDDVLSGAEADSVSARPRPSQL